MERNVVESIVKLTRIMLWQNHTTADIVDKVMEKQEESSRISVEVIHKEEPDA